ncbi:hypothetical protein PCIT_b0447 [Pseudoalteromonas citrea]|uniref:Uncharacterized protein n=1 Tax=Pseudoalteromonas citrea TaxID=43655 RepID=A0AAD4AEG8_9GAMM|nr:hypothetical protein PCIT_b0447 [Pseudoalteromonas citrea]
MASPNLERVNSWVIILVCEHGKVAFYSKSTVIYDVIGTYYYLLYIDDVFLVWGMNRTCSP